MTLDIVHDPIYHNELLLVGAIALKPSAVERLADVIQADDFSLPFFQEFWKVCKRMHRDRGACDMALVMQSLQRQGMKPDDLSTLAHAIHDAPLTPHAEQYAEQLLIERQRVLGDRIQQLLNDSPDTGSLSDAQRLLASYQERLALVRGEEHQRSEHLASCLPEKYYDAAHSERGTNMIPTFHSFVDQAIGGPLSPGSFVVVGARPGNGKTLMILHQLLRCAEAGRTCVFFSQEMTAEAVGERLATMAGVHLGMDRADFVERARAWFPSRDIIFAREQPTPAALVAAMDRYRDEFDATVFAVDYLQLLSGRGTTAYERATDVCKTLKLYATQTGSTAIMAAQLNRNSAEGDALPRLHHFRDTGQIEQDADAVFMLRMPSMDTAPPMVDSLPRERTIEVYARKLRNRPASRLFADALLLDDNLGLLPPGGGGDLGDNGDASDF